MVKKSDFNICEKRQLLVRVTDRHAKFVSLLSEKKINRETNDGANNALSLQNKVSIKFHKEKKNQ